MSNWRNKLNWSTIPLFDQIIESLQIPTPKNAISQMEPGDRTMLRDWGFSRDSDIKRSWVYRILNKVKSNTDSNVLLEEEGFSRVKRSLEYGVLNLNDGVLSLSSKGEHLWDLLINRLIPSQNAHKNADKYFDMISEYIGNALIQADATDIISFYKTPKKIYNQYYFGTLNKKVVKYIEQIEKNLLNTFGTNMSNYHNYDAEDIAVLIIQEGIGNSGNYERQNNSILEYVKANYPEYKVQYVLLESEGILCGRRNKFYE